LLQETESLRKSDSSFTSGVAEVSSFASTVTEASTFAQGYGGQDGGQESCGGTTLTS